MELEFGKKITALRNSNGMSQAELADALGVPLAEVRKWEGDVSFPDYETLSKLARLFKVPISYFSDTEIATARDISRSYGRAGRTQARSCGRRNRGLIVSGIINAIILICAIAFAIAKKDMQRLLGGCISVVFLFPFVAQLFYDGAIVDTCLFGCKMLGDIGVIFTLDLDGILFLIVFKLLWFLIRIVFFILTVIFFAFIAILISPLTFIHALIRVSNEPDDFDI